MPATNWHKFLLLFLWITPHALLGVLAVILWKRRLSRQFPCFLTYVLCEIAGFIVLFTLYWIPGAGKQYAYAYCARMLLSIALRFGVVGELSHDLLRGSDLLKVAARRWLQWVQGFLIVINILIAIYLPAGNGARFTAGVFLVNRGAAMIQCGTLLALLLLSRFMGLSWHRAAFAIALGLAVLTSLDIGTFALRAAFNSPAAREFLNLLIAGSYLVCVSTWIGYLLLPEPEPLTPLAVLPQEQVETWNMELKHLLRD